MTAFSFQHRWLPGLHQRIVKHGVNFVAAVYLEYNSVLEVPLADFFRFVNLAGTPLVWPGFVKEQAWKAVQGSKVIVFMEDALGDGTSHVPLYGKVNKV